MRSRRAARVPSLVLVTSAALWLGCGGGGADITGPPPGTLDVVTSTSGPEPDPDGYAVSIDGGAAQPVQPSATRRTEGLAVGPHRVELSGVAGNCAVAGPGVSVTVSVSAGAVAVASFAVACSPTTGAVQLTTISSGTPPDPDGYEILLDGTPAQPIAGSAVVSLAGLAPGTHALGLAGLADNCVVDGANPRDVAVTAGATASVAIAVTCSSPTPPPAPGSISVVTQTGGTDPDPDGYAVTLDGGTAVPIGTDATLPLADLAAGPHSVGLTGIGGNCRLDGDNPRTVVVTEGTVAGVTFTITCEALPPSTGSLEVTTATTGFNLDSDGYTFAIDGGDGRPIGVSAAATVAGLAAGPHTVRLRGLAANCTTGDNPRTLTVPAGGTAQLTFAIACAAATGGLRITTVTTGTPADPDGYTVSVDGGAPAAIGTAASLILDNLEPRAHAVLLAGLAANCTVQGTNPRTATVLAGDTALAAFGVSCAATAGALAVTIAGLPAGTDAALTITGPGGFTRSPTATTTFADLAPGAYSVTAEDVPAGGTTYTPSPRSHAVTVAAGDTASATVTYGPAAGPTLNLRIAGWSLTQSVQTLAGDVPLVANRDGFLRVFVVADDANSATPAVRVRLYRNGSLTQTLSIPAPGNATPTSRNEASLASSWNVKIPRELFGPGLGLLADVDPGNAIPEKNESDNSFPAGGSPQAQVVASVPVLGVRFVPVRQQANGLEGDVSAGNKSSYLDLPRRMYPIAGADGDLHAPYTTTTAGELQPGDENGAWVAILSELNSLRVAEGTSRNYYGVVRIGYPSGIAGLGYLGTPTAMGYDRLDDRSRVMAHELGHNFNRAHSPCGQPAGVDPNYPYPGGLTGVYGYDLQADVLRGPLLPDIMGYCNDPWISDYTYDAVLADRAASQAALAAAASATPQRCLLVWGRIVDGRPVLEPAFEIVTRPSLPRVSGPYAIEALAEDGSRRFRLSFDAALVADGRREARQFAFAVPLGPGRPESIGRLTLAGPGGQVAAMRAPAAAAVSATSDVVEARAVAGGVGLHWDAAAHPMIMVRDPATGEVLSFGRSGQTLVATSRSALDVVMSDGVVSRLVRVAVAR